MPIKLMNEIEEEVTDLLSNLISINTTNPPGNEAEAAEFLAKVLAKEGFTCELFESTSKRGNIITRLEGTGEKPSLLLLSHLDVVPANPKEWSVDPFGGVVKDGFVWGRGALDMKSMTAIEVMVMKLLKRNNIHLKGDVILAATADEEKGGRAGAGWLVQNHPDKVQAKYVLNEGGGLAIPINGKEIFTIQTAEKGILWIKIKAEGKPGHGSVPGVADNAIMRMNRVVEKLGNYHQKVTLIPTVKKFLNRIAEENELVHQALSILTEDPEKTDQILDMMAQKEKAMAEEVRAMLRMTIAPTIIKGGEKENIIPSECEAIFDCRILPGQVSSEALKEIKDLFEKSDLEKLTFEIIQSSTPSESSMDTPLYRSIVNMLKDNDPDCQTAPILLTGGTDSRFFRKMGSICYGFQPMHSDLPYGEILKMIHGIDERISIENLVLGTSILYHLVKDFMT
ncbi:MAG: M20/M25/M40 family metallo-hydrolase [Candidatus Bathyarchaeota archaeon]|jgi:acetylornithine deacetylase/succinyl-diaminopimelate desuccinylase-like protein